MLQVSLVSVLMLMLLSSFDHVRTLLYHLSCGGKWRDVKLDRNLEVL